MMKATLTGLVTRTFLLVSFSLAGTGAAADAARDGHYDCRAGDLVAGVTLQTEGPRLRIDDRSGETAGYCQYQRSPSGDTERYAMPRGEGYWVGLTFTKGSPPTLQYCDGCVVFQCSKD